MASILDAGIVGLFTGVFVFLLVYAIMWGVLSRTKWLGENKSPNSIIAFAVALLMAIAPPAREFVTFVAPWYVALFIVLFFVLFIVALFGKTEKDFPKIIEDGKTQTWIIILCSLIFIAGIAFTFGQQTFEAANPGLTGTEGTPVVGPGTTGTVGGYPDAGQPGSTATPNFQQNFLNTLTHPKVLGILVTFFIAAIAVYFLSQPS